MTRPDRNGRTPPDTSATGRVATGTHRADSTTIATTVHLPLDPSGSTLAAVIREVRIAIVRGDVIIDSRQASGWPPGPRLVLDRLQRLTHRAGHHWHDVAAEVSDDGSASAARPPGVPPQYA